MKNASIKENANANKTIIDIFLTNCTCHPDRNSHGKKAIIVVITAKKTGFEIYVEDNLACQDLYDYLFEYGV